MHERLRYALIGIGAGILNGHRPALALPEVDLVAAADTNSPVGQERARELHCAFYEDYQAMLAEVRPDVVVILTPPFLHASMTIDCLQAGCHVLVEKPMAVQIAEAEQMIEAAERHQRILGVVFQHRYRPEILAARQLLEAGKLGTIQRVDLTAIWTRPASYYALAPWRATWGGEGGGILTNQASHHLDLLCHLLGLPERVVAWTRRLIHPIETEDTVHAMVEWAKGALGSIHISTAEADEAERLKIVGSRGSLLLGRGSLQVEVLDREMQEYVATSLNPYAQPERHPVSVALPQSKGDHVAVYQRFHEAILQRGRDYCNGRQASMELELANAMIYSNATQTQVELPLDPQIYTSLLKDLQQTSTYSIIVKDA